MRTVNRYDRGPLLATSTGCVAVMVCVVSVELDVVPVSVVSETSVFEVPDLLVVDVNVAVVVVQHLNYLKANYDPT